VKEFASPRVQVAGILAEELSMRGRTIQQKPILGTVDELQEILQSLEVHGVAVDRIVVATAAGRLQQHSLETLLEVEKSSGVLVQFLSERLGLEATSLRPLRPPILLGQEHHSVVRQRAVSQGERAVPPNHANLAVPPNHANLMTKSFRIAKRLVDIFGAALLVLTLAPLAIPISFVVALDVGFPLIFWQQRPGLCGRPFRLYKFRTMRAPHDEHHRRITDDQRSSVIGQLLRRSRLDELPQLYNVLVGRSISGICCSFAHATWHYRLGAGKWRANNFHY
jgi:hypothetical protein